MTRYFLIAGILSVFAAGAAQAAGDYFLQLASVKSEQAAKGEWVRLQKSHAEILGGMDLNVQSADLGEQGVFYRIQTGPFPNKATAEDLCWQLRAAKQDCLVIRR